MFSSLDNLNEEIAKVKLQLENLSLEIMISKRRERFGKMLAREILTLNPTSGELGEGKARRLIELAEEVLRDDAS